MLEDLEEHVHYQLYAFYISATLEFCSEFLKKPIMIFFRYS